MSTIFKQAYVPSLSLNFFIATTSPVTWISSDKTYETTAQNVSTLLNKFTTYLCRPTLNTESTVS